MSDEEICQERAFTDHRDVRGHKCGRAVKEDGLCGVHLAAKRRRQAGDADRNRRHLEDEERLRVAQEFCARLAEAGVQASPHWSWHPKGSRYTGEVVIKDPEALLRALG